MGYPGQPGVPLYFERQALTRSPLTPTVIVNPAKYPIIVQPNGSISGDGGIGNPQAGDGIQMTQVKAIVVTIIANSGFVFAGGGALNCWLFDPNLPTPQWVRAADFDLALTWPTGVTPVGSRIFPSLRFPVRGGSHVLWVANAITLTPSTGNGSGDFLLKIQGFDGQFPS